MKRVIVAVVGGTVLLFGIALLVLPGPAFLVIPAGLAILATEFVWARRWLHRAKAMITRRAATQATAGIGSNAGPARPDAGTAGSPVVEVAGSPPEVAVVTDTASGNTAPQTTAGAH